MTAETLVNLIQLAITGACMVISLLRAVRQSSREWVLLGLFYVLFFMGDLYWSLMLALYGSTPSYFFVSETGWYSAFLFLGLLLRQLSTDDELEYRPKVLWIIPVFTSAMAVFYMQYGDYLINIVVAILMGTLMWHSVRGIMYIRLRPDPSVSAQRKMLYLCVMAFCLIEYCEWTASCFMSRQDVRILYFLFDAAVSLTMILYIPALRKAVQK